jgi:hypothetical protein
MPRINGAQGTPKTVDVLENSETGVKTENSTPKGTVDTFEPGQARTAKGEAYLKLMERAKESPGEARTAKGAAYLKWKEHHQETDEPGKARTAKGEAYLKMMKAEAATIQNQPGDAPRTKKQSVQH